MARSKVVHLTTVHPFSDTRILAKECAILSEHGFDVTLLAQDVDSGNQSVPANVMLMGPRPGRLLRIPLGYARAISNLVRLRPDLLHVHDPELIPLAALWRMVTRRPAIYDAHEDLALQVISGKSYIPAVARPLVRRAARALEKLADAALDCVVVATPRLAENFSKRTVLVQNFPRLNAFRASPTALPALPGAVYIGAISDVRGGHVMLEAARLSNTTLTLAGRVADRKFSERLAGRLTDAGVVYLGPVDSSDVPELLSNSWVGLCVLQPIPNYLEAQSTKLYEYMASGRPFIASDFPFWVEHLGRFECGVFVDPTDVHAVANAISRLTGDREAATAMGSRGRDAFLAHFNFEGEGAKLISLYKELLRC